MSDTHVEVRRSSWLDNIVGSVIGAVIGVVLFVGSFPLIWYGESRTNMAEVAASSTTVAPDRANAANDGRLVAVSAPVQGEPLGDPGFLRPGDYVALDRIAQMYAWVEIEETETEDNVGGGSTQRTTYTYERRWTESPEDSASFRYPSGHTNPPMEIESARLRADGGQIGGFAVDLQGLELPGGELLTLTPEIVIQDSRWSLVDGFLFDGDGTMQSPQIGDMRIAYRALRAGVPVTVFAEQRGSELVAHRTPRGDVMFRALEGDREAAIEQLRVEDTIWDWVFRIVSLLVMWVGMMLAVGPVGAVLGVLPALKRASGCALGAITFGIAVVLWGVTVLVAIVLNNIWLTIGVALLIAAGVFLAARARRPAGVGQAA